MPAAAVTPAGVRDGDPAALIGLCSVRGPSVLAYCRHVAGEVDAATAAADAFGRFRLAVIATDVLSGLNPDALLISATRQAAATHAAHHMQGICAAVPALLAGRADKSLAIADLARLEQHLETCWACRAPVARFTAAERAYSDPPEETLDHATAAQIFVALATVAPMRDAEPPPAPAMQANAGAPLPPAVEAAQALDQPTTEYRTLDAPQPETDRPPAVAAAPGIPSAPEPENTGAVAGAGDARRPRRRGSSAPAGVAAARSSARRERKRPALRLSIVLPVAVVFVALLVALFVSGVFGGSDPASSPRVDVPADAPADSAPADVVVVPGATQASPSAVEVAKSRERARARRKREAALERQREAAQPATAAPPAAATPPPVVVAPPPAGNRADATPDRAPDGGGSGTGGSRKIDAGDGATGSEQIPSAQDSSTVPDLAPPPEPATSP